MKRRVLGLLLFLLIIPFFMGCDQTTTTTAATATTTEELTSAVTTQDTESTTISYLGMVTIQIITAGDDPETTEVETEYVSNELVVGYLEDDTLFGLLEENFTISYETSTYGSYLTAIDTLIPSESNQYIAFYINDAYAMTGVDATDLVDGSVYQFKIESF